MTIYTPNDLVPLRPVHRPSGNVRVNRLESRIENLTISKVSHMLGCANLVPRAFLRFGKEGFCTHL
jgi:hypothetical protein